MHVPVPTMSEQDDYSDSFIDSINRYCSREEKELITELLAPYAGRYMKVFDKCENGVSIFCDGLITSIEDENMSITLDIENAWCPELFVGKPIQEVVDLLDIKLCTAYDISVIMFLIAKFLGIEDNLERDYDDTIYVWRKEDTIQHYKQWSMLCVMMSLLLGGPVWRLIDKKIAIPTSTMLGIPIQSLNMVYSIAHNSIEAGGWEIRDNFFMSHMTYEILLLSRIEPKKMEMPFVFV